MLERIMCMLVGIALGLMLAMVLAFAMLIREPKQDKPLTKEEWKVSDYEN